MQPIDGKFVSQLDILKIHAVYPALRPDGTLFFNVRHLPRASLPVTGVTVHGVKSCFTSEVFPLPSSLILAHAPDHDPPIVSFLYRQPVFAGCCESLLHHGPSRCCLRRTFLRCLDPYSGRLQVACTRFFTQSIGFPPVCTGSAPCTYPANDFTPGNTFGAAVIPLCSDPGVCSLP